MAKHRVVMIRHCESEWTMKLCGWYDANLSDQGEELARAAGVGLSNFGHKIDFAHTSMLTRAQRTMEIALQEAGLTGLPVQKTWLLNCRHYGALTGLRKDSEKLAQIWQRSYDKIPPKMEADHQYFDIIVKDPRYRGILHEKDIPSCESFEHTIERTLVYWHSVIIPQLKEGKTVLITAHGSSLMGIVQHLDKHSVESIMALKIPTGIPFVYELDENFSTVVSMRFLADEETVQKGMERVTALRTKLYAPDNINH